MKKIIIIGVFVALILGSCARGVTPYEAANRKQKCGRSYVK